MSRNDYLWKIFKLTCAITFAFIFIRSFVVEPGIVDGVSMEPNFFDSQVFFINKFDLLFHSPDRGDVVQASIPSLKEVVIKRVIGLPGEQVTIRLNQVFVTGMDGKTFLLGETYLPEGTVTRNWNGSAQTFDILKENEYFLLGDNRDESTDSREYGPVTRDHIFGLVFSFSQ
ncbi:TPA: signal peptidase I [Candidatus Uhrbacteria bacterium]|uniref:Signal peptidase I n=2 Tax=Candidatus Uhriibacteriota TaxID=1752732 RepID=A0A0G1T8S7_9BACT|nr:MAG: Signal peptidase I [Candidatus Uhrbacteria bacterium GW2011_GWF2_46_218]KKU41810.1 MAG: Signal peptidase I [Candidatus Uhrbacteria bacterium GW2011_GWE2_46_68]HBK34140.1 signal peptidase I [Candidatus Uhrbacteria bacterium]HCB18788.1 signal peptidase I [Candidatus Uhrbacteria bacterium]